ncbi:alpha-(1,3)-fucosyltransferase C [Megachile rotundata]|uniref:alpha-(1,3)-fucosyltransferase C n=1 Tax=Megachile rotundata TaxID=143995 RepID=UPI003FD55D8F
MKSWILGKSSLIVLLTFIFSLYFLSFYFNCRIYDILRLRRIMADDSRVVNTTKKILFWNTMFGKKMFYTGEDDIFRDCPVNDCYATYDRSYANLTDFDAVLFHNNDFDLADLPAKRSSKQYYVFVNLESPTNRPLVSNFLEDFFNLTMTYRLDSDVAWYYGIVRDLNTKQFVAPSRDVSWKAFYNRSEETDWKKWSSDSIRGKRRPIVWFVSNCEAKSGRQEYVRELSRHIPVDVYGNCGNMYCPRSTDCFAEIAEPGYFFYLSLENSLCEDYVTEKLFNALRYNVVPIVYGGANYSQFAPPRSYINVFDFDTPKDLAEYLKKLMRNPFEYGRYFEWKKYYVIEGGVHEAKCNLCKFLHEKQEPRMYNPLSDWYSKSKCPLQNFLRSQNYVSGNTLKHQD